MYEFGTIGSGKGLALSRVPAPPGTQREYVVLFPTRVLIHELWRRFGVWLKRLLRHE